MTKFRFFDMIHSVCIESVVSEEFVLFLLISLLIHVDEVISIMPSEQVDGHISVDIVFFAVTALDDGGRIKRPIRASETAWCVAFPLH